MFVVISGTNRPGSRTLQVSRLAARELEAAGAEARLLDLLELPEELFRPEAYATKPAAFADWQAAILEAEGIVAVTPEYNGSFPGALKYFIDMLEFPKSLVGKPSCFVGLAAGEWGGLRAVEQLQMVFNYRKAHLYGERVFLAAVHEALDAEGRLVDAAMRRRFEHTLRGFVGWARKHGP